MRRATDGRTSGPSGLPTPSSAGHRGSGGGRATLAVLSWKCLPPGLQKTHQASDPLVSGLTWPRFADPRQLRAEVILMNVLAVSIPGRPDWRWRIVGHNGETVEQSSTAFPTIAEAVAAGRERLQRHPDRDAPVVHRRWAPGR